MPGWGAIIICVALLVSGCSQSKVIDGKEYRPYGLINADQRKNPRIEYDVVWGNVVWGCILFETAIGPVYFFGFDLFEPVGPKKSEPA